MIESFSEFIQLKFSKLEHQSVLINSKKNNQKALKLKPQVNHKIWKNLALINKDEGVAQAIGALYSFFRDIALDPALNFQIKPWHLQMTQA